jgi:hypothetical protein
VDYTKFLQVLKDEILRRLQTPTRSGKAVPLTDDVEVVATPQPGVLRMLFIVLLLCKWELRRL